MTNNNATNNATNTNTNTNNASNNGTLRLWLRSSNLATAQRLAQATGAQLTSDGRTKSLRCGCCTQDLGGDWLRLDLDQTAQDRLNCRSQSQLTALLSWLGLDTTRRQTRNWAQQNADLWSNLFN